VFLSKAASYKKELLARKKDYYRRCLEEAVYAVSEKRFSRALGTPGVSIIAEIKKTSPSAGRLTGFSAGELAEVYRSSGADAISVLTEDKYFSGSPEDLRTAAGVFGGPALMKDFIISPLQVAEAACLGASAVLLIAGLLPGRKLSELLNCASEYGLEALVEIHAPWEVDRCLEAGAEIIGVNSRDLVTLEVDPSAHTDIAALIPPDIIRVAESGISSAGRVRELAAAGYDAFLVGGALLLSDDPGGMVKSLKGI